MSRVNSIQKLLKIKKDQKDASKNRILDVLKSGDKSVYEICEDESQMRQTRRLLKELEDEGLIKKEKHLGKGNRSAYSLVK